MEMKKRFFSAFTVLLLLTAGGCSLPKITLFPDGRGPLKEFVLEGGGEDKVLIIPVRGKITDAPKKGMLRSGPGTVQTVVSHLRKAEKDENIKAVILKVDSPGGTVTASDLLYHEISEFKRKSGAKIVAAMMNLAASGAYYISLPADLIMAHPTTVTGSVGVIIMRPNVAGLMEKLGVSVPVHKTGENKDTGSPFRNLTPEEDAMIQGLADGLGRRFINLVRKHRELTEEALKTVATARVFLAHEAKSLGLVDEIGYLDDAVKAAGKLAKLPSDAKVVIYRRSAYSDDHIYINAGATAEPPVSLIETGWPVDPLPAGFYYIWPTGAQ